eukprot:TRINITY_DN26_c0_g1_i9.p1 TRINITY_DN26_c0_g1~~TRINITY_DN26_c0_g1_i9.p1  ORF type:complete len:363 (+),score=57.95 TRINITY_DN26_c0_g1_i9:497-1585(+)
MAQSSQCLLFSSLLLLALLSPPVRGAPAGFFRSCESKSSGDCGNLCRADGGCLSSLYDITGLLNLQCGSPRSHSCFFFSVSSGGRGEPHFHGADASRFDFSGVPNTTYTLFTDADLHVNAYFGGRYGQWGEDSHHSITWMRKLAIFHGHHTLALEAREGPEWEYGTGYMAKMRFNGEDFKLSQAGDTAELADGIRVSWVVAKEQNVDDFVDVYEVDIPGLLSLRLTLRPEVSHLRTAEDGAVHFGVDVKFVSLSSTAHGILGQTYREDHAGRFEMSPKVWSDLLQTFMVAAPDAEGFLDGKASDYATSALLKTDSPVSRFVQATSIEEVAPHSTEALAASSSFSPEDESVIRLNRKLLAISL